MIKILSIIIPCLLISACVKKEQPSSIQEAENITENFENIEPIFYELKPTKEAAAKLGLGEVKLDERDIVENPKKFYQNLKKIIENEEGVLSFNANPTVMAYTLIIDTPIEDTTNVDELKVFTKKVLDIVIKINDLSYGHTLKNIDVKYFLHDKSYFSTNFNISELLINKDKDTYLLLSAVNKNKQFSDGKAADLAIKRMCNNFLSIELNPYFCSNKEKEDKAVKALTKKEKNITNTPQESYDNAINSEDDVTKQKKSELSDKDKQTLIDAGFDVELQ
jgi:hypothetical protein